ncbi:hypothetical protein D3P07_04915 [Paenibacillus sp. 1011MAR3C5]|uniref:hypothetical protein n=1 Tax=Paenibacillus sp. 1011MAR3C5 TaxID=1675787 RepID=UPI000E6BAC6A|nr:hypothetical protein [Paenibacillus sp. 1011MAR3C5]RJE89590.1 hypothetical protein D3P07_04915 [Paenibacillus sp. 1011MAR3C5]
MNRKLILIIVGVILAFAILYGVVGWQIGERSKEIIEMGMKSSDQQRQYANYMTEEVYQQLHPVPRGMTNYSGSYQPEHHDYGIIGFPIHLFGVASVKVSNYYNDGSLGFNEEVHLRIRWKGGKWIATDVNIKA